MLEGAFAIKSLSLIRRKLVGQETFPNRRLRNARSGVSVVSRNFVKLVPNQAYSDIVSDRSTMFNGPSC